MDYKYIRLITAIVEAGSLSKAAEELHLTQSALSHQLKELESQENMLFFDRANRRLTLTAAGRIVYESGRTILMELNKMDASLKSISSENTGKIRVMAACTSSYHWLAGVLNDYKAEYPQVEVEIVLDSKGDPIQEILKGRVDVVVMVSLEENELIHYEKLFDDELVAVFSNAHRFSTKSYVIAKDFKEEHLIIHSYPLNTVVFYEKVLKPKGVEPAKISALPLTEATIELIKAGYGVAVMPRWSIAPYIEKGTVSCCKINRSGLFRSHYAARLSGAVPGYIARFIDCLKNAD